MKLFRLFKNDRGPRWFREGRCDYGGYYEVWSKHPMVWGDLDHTDTNYKGRARPNFYPRIMIEGDLYVGT